MKSGRSTKRRITRRLNDELDHIKLQLCDIDKKIELSKKEHSAELFEQIKPLLRDLEELGYFVKFQYGPTFHDPYTNSYYHKDNYYSLEKL